MRIQSIFITTLLIGAISSCDYVEDPTPIVTETNADCDTVFDVSASVTTLKNVLLEDFSGHKCPNCPGANGVAASIADANPDRVIVVTIHPDPNIVTSMSTLVGENAPGSGSYETAWYIPEGGELMDFFGDPGYLPVGFVDRIMNTTFGWKYWDFTSWSTETTARLLEPLDVSLAGHATLLPDGTVCGQTKVEYLNNYTGDIRIVHYLTEDSITDYQLNGATTIPNYMHRHVLRAVSNNQIWGQEVATGTNSSGTTTEHTYSFENYTVVDDHHLKVVAFIYDDGTKDVLQTIEFELD